MLNNEQIFRPKINIHERHEACDAGPLKVMNGN